MMTSCPLQAALSARVPELAENLVEIVAVARDPGVRAKVAVRSRVEGLNAVGACIGWSGLRITDVEKRLHGEHVSIVAYDADPCTYVINALAAESAIGEITDAEQRRIRVRVDCAEYPRTLGKNRHNLRLARQLTHWHIHLGTHDTPDRHEPAPIPQLALTR